MNSNPLGQTWMHCKYAFLFGGTCWWPDKSIQILYESRVAGDCLICLMSRFTSWVFYIYKTQVVQTVPSIIPWSFRELELKAFHILTTAPCNQFHPPFPPTHLSHSLLYLVTPKKHIEVVKLSPDESWKQVSPKSVWYKMGPYQLQIGL